MRKGQVEMIGLVIIVILLVFIGVFALILGSRSNGDETEDLFLGLKASNLANSLRFMSIGNSDFSQRMIDCCSGIDTLACEDVEGAANSGFKLMEEKTSLIVDCYTGAEFVYGDCSTGINSEKIVLSSGDMFFVRICRK